MIIKPQTVSLEIFNKDIVGFLNRAAGSEAFHVVSPNGKEDIVILPIAEYEALKSEKTERNYSYSTTLKSNGEGGAFLMLPEEMLAMMDVKLGDRLALEVLPGGRLSLTKAAADATGDCVTVVEMPSAG